MIDLTLQFKRSMRHRLTKRTVFEMMFNKQEQAKIIEPFSRHYSVNSQLHASHQRQRLSIARLGISDMLSVRLKLMEWINTKDGEIPGIRVVCYIRVILCRC